MRTERLAEPRAVSSQAIDILGFHDLVSVAADTIGLQLIRMHNDHMPRPLAGSVHVAPNDGGYHNQYKGFDQQSKLN